MTAGSPLASVPSAGGGLRSSPEPALSAWVLTDGKAGDEGPCLGVAEAMGLSPRLVRIAPRRPWSWFLPRGPVDPRERPGLAGSPLQPPWPDLVVGSGRRAVAYLRSVKDASEGRAFTVCLKDPRIGAGVADLVWVPVYDRLRADNVIVTATSPHRLGQARLAAARDRPDPRLDGLSGRRAAVLVGGGSRRGRFEPADEDRLAADLARLVRDGVALMMTASRRTPASLRATLARLAAETGGFLWDGRDPNPIAGMLARADLVVVSADSINMASEAAATGRPVLLFKPRLLSVRQQAFAHHLETAGIARPFAGRAEWYSYPPLDSTPTVAAAMADALQRHRERLGLA